MGHDACIAYIVLMWVIFVNFSMVKICFRQGFGVCISNHVFFKTAFSFWEMGSKKHKKTQAHLPAFVV